MERGIPIRFFPALVEFFHNRFNTSRDSIITGVERLAPRHYLLLDSAHNITKSAYWDLRHITPWLTSLEEAREALDAA